MRYREHRIAVGRSIHLLTREFRPDGDAHATCVLLHGAAEHGGRHAHVARRICQQGWRVIVPDMRGHGRSGGPSMHVLQFGRYVDDLARIHDHFRLDPATTVGQGYSLGGLVTTRFAQRHAGRLHAIALTCPLLGLAVRIPRCLYVSGRVLAWTYPWTRFEMTVDPAEVTRCDSSRAERDSDPLYRNTVTAGWFFAMRRAIRAAWREAAAITPPTLLVQSGDDRIVDPTAGRHWLSRVGSSETRYQELPGHFHEWHYEPTWARTADGIEQWLSWQLHGTSRATVAADAAVVETKTATPAA